MADIAQMQRAANVEIRYLVVAALDSATTRRYSDFPITLDSHDYEPLIARDGLRIEGARIKRIGGIGPAIGARIQIADDGSESAITDTSIVINSPITLYMLFVDGGNETEDDRIVLIDGVLESQRFEEGIWLIGIRDDTKRFLRRFPSRILTPVEFPYAYTFGQPVPIVFGRMDSIPAGQASAVLAPCAITDKFAVAVTPGKGSFTNTLWQWYPQSDLYAQIEFFNQDAPGEVDYATPKRKLVLRPLRTKINNDVTGWRPVASGGADTATIGTNETLALYFAGSAALGELVSIRIVIEASGDYDIRVFNDRTELGTVQTGDDRHVVALDREIFQEWALALLNIEIANSASATESTTITDIRLEISFDDFNAYQDQSPQIYAACSGYTDDADNYADGTVIVADGQVLENPVHILEAIFRDKDILGMETSRLVHGWQEAATSRENWRFAFSLDQAQGYPWLDRFCFEAGLALFSDGGGFSVAALDENRDPTYYFSGDWDCPVLNWESGDPARWDYDIEIQSGDAEEVTNEVHLRYAKHGPTGEFRRAVTASGEHRVASTCSVNDDSELTDSAADFNDLGVLVGETVHVEGDVDYEVVRIVSDHVLEIASKGLGVDCPPKAAGTDYWLGLNLDGAMLQSQDDYHTVNPLGQEQIDFTDEGGYNSEYIADDATAQLLVEHVRNWQARLRDRLFFPLTHVGSGLRAGDVFMMDHPRFRAHQRPSDISSLSADLGGGSGDTTISLDEVAELQPGDWLVLHTSRGQPEVVRVSEVDRAANTAVVERAQLNTARLAWADDTEIKRLETKFIALHVQPMQPGQPFVRVECMVMPPWYRRIAHYTASTADDYDSSSDQERQEQGYYTLENGRVVDTEDDSAISYYGF